MATIDELARIAGNTFPANTPGAIGAEALRPPVADAVPARLGAPSSIAQVGASAPPQSLGIGPIARAANLASAGWTSGDSAFAPRLGAERPSTTIAEVAQTPGFGTPRESAANPTLNLGDSQKDMIPTPDNPNPVQLTPNQIATGQQPPATMPTTPQASPTQEAEMRRIQLQAAPATSITTARTANGPLSVPMAQKNAGNAPAPQDIASQMSALMEQGNAPGEIAHQKASASGLANLSAGEVPTFVFGDGREVTKADMTPEDQAALARWNGRQDQLYQLQGGNQDGQGPQVVYTGKGPLVNGTPTPSSLLAPGSEKQLDNYLAAAQQGAVNVVDPMGAKTIQELAKISLENKGKLDAAQVMAGAQKGEIYQSANGPVMIDKRTNTAQPITMNGESLAPKLKDIPAPIQKALIENNTSLRKIDAALAAVEAYPAGLGAWNYLGDTVRQRSDSEGVDVRAYVGDIGSLKIHDRSGAAVTASETPRLKPFIPSVTDDSKTVKKKLNLFKQEYDGINQDISSTYSAEQGYKQFPSKEPVIPKAATAFLQAHPETRTHFETKYGKGSADSILRGPGFADGGMIGDDMAGQLAAEQRQREDEQAANAAVVRGNEAIGLESMGYDTQELGYANGGLIGGAYDSRTTNRLLDPNSPIHDTMNSIMALPMAERQAAAHSLGMGVANDSPNGGLNITNPNGSTIRTGPPQTATAEQRAAASAFSAPASDPLKPFSMLNSSSYSAYANGGQIQGPGANDSVPAGVGRQRPNRGNDGDYIIPAAVVKRLGTKYFDNLLKQNQEDQ